MKQGDVPSLYVALYPKMVAELTMIGGSRPLAEDATNEAFVRFLVNFDKVSRYDRPGAWLRKVARRVLIDDLRQRSRTAVWQQGSEPEVAPRTGSRSIWEAVLQLPMPLREVIVLRAAHDLSDAEIAHELGVPIGTVKSRLSRARHQMQVKLGDGQDG